MLAATVALICLGPTSLQSPDARSLRVFHVGNSVTDTIRYPAFQKMAASGSQNYIFGRHMIPGAPLSWLWDHPNDGFFEEPFGRYPKALTEHRWDVLTLQPFDRQLEGTDGDLAMARKFIDLALPKSPDLRVVVYSRWPRKKDDGSLNFAEAWGRRYTGGWDNSNESKDYFERLQGALQAAYPKLRVDMAPVGDVLLALDASLKAKPFGSLDSVNDFYVDGIHFGDAGALTVGTTFYTVLFGRDPKGLDATPYGKLDPEVVRRIQEVTWQVVSKHPRSGLRR